MRSTKKVVTVKGAGKPVKKPLCAVHKTEMRFDPGDQKWRCMEDNCNLVARPKRDAEDKSVLIGKGSVSLRIVHDGVSTRALLISDDNIALDITAYVNPAQVQTQFDLGKQALAASRNGKDTFTIPTEHPFTIKVKAAMIGATTYVEKVLGSGK